MEYFIKYIIIGVLFIMTLEIFMIEKNGIKLINVLEIFSSELKNSNESLKESEITVLELAKIIYIILFIFYPIVIMDYIFKEFNKDE
jgi:hypothetical protein